MFPLKNRKLIRGFTAHIKAGLGGAADYVADKTFLYAPFSGKAETYSGVQGGNWLRLTRDNGDKIEFAHLSKYLITPKTVSDGELIAITGNTGTVTTGPHLHIQIFNKQNKRLDPEVYDWNSLTKTFMKVTIVVNKPTWDFRAEIPQLVEMFKIASNNRLEPVFDVVETNFNAIPFAPFTNGKASIDINWYRNNITPLATGEMTLFMVNPELYQPDSGTWGFMTYGDAGKPVRSEISAHNNPSFPEAPEWVHRAFHEIAHGLFFLTGQPDVSPVDPADALVHYWLYQDPPKRKELMDIIDYPKLQAKLLTIKPPTPMPQSQAKVVKSKVDGSIFVAYEMPDMDYLQKKAALEGFSIPNPIPDTDSLK